MRSCQLGINPEPGCRDFLDFVQQMLAGDDLEVCVGEPSLEDAARRAVRDRGGHEDVRVQHDSHRAGSACPACLADCPHFLDGEVERLVFGEV